MKVGELPTYAAEVLAIAKDLVLSQVAKIQELDVAVLLFGVLTAVLLALLLPQLLRMKAAADKAAAEKAAAGGKRLWDAASDGNVDEVSAPHSEPELSTTHSTLSTTPISPSPILKMAGEDPLQRMGWQHCCPQLEE